MTDKDLLDVILEKGQLVLFFKHCALEDRDPIKVRHQGLNVLTALLLAKISHEQRLRDLLALADGLHSLKGPLFSAFADEPFNYPPQDKSSQTSARVAMVWLAQHSALPEFEDLWGFMRSRGYDPSKPIMEDISRALKKSHGPVDCVVRGILE